MNKYLSRFLFVILPPLILLLSVSFFFALHALKEKPKKKGGDGPKGAAVFSTEAEAKNLYLTVTSRGQVEPYTEVDLVPEVRGKIIFVAPGFVQGGSVKKGEVLLRLDDANYQAAFIRAEAALKKAEQNLIREQAEAKLARQDWKDLGHGEPASPLALREPQLADAQAAVMAAKADVNKARIDLEATAIRAPFAGRIKSKNADLGQYVSSGQVLGHIFATDRVEIKLPLSDSDLYRLDLPVAFVESSHHKGPDVQISGLVAGEPHIWQGRLTRTDSAFDARTRTLNAFVEVKDPYGENQASPLPVGLFVQADIQGRHVPHALVLPASSLRDQDKVYVINQDNTLTVRTVKLADSNTHNIIVKEGISPGERVVTSALIGAHDGMLLHVLDSEENSEGSASGTESEEAEAQKARNTEPEEQDQKEEDTAS